MISVERALQLTAHLGDRIHTSIYKDLLVSPLFQILSQQQQEIDQANGETPSFSASAVVFIASVAFAAGEIFGANVTLAACDTGNVIREALEQVKAELAARANTNQQKS